MQEHQQSLNDRRRGVLSQFASAIDLPLWSFVYGIFRALKLTCIYTIGVPTETLEILMFLFIMSFVTAVLAIAANQYQTQKVVFRYISCSVVLTLVHLIVVMGELESTTERPQHPFVDHYLSNQRLIEFSLFVLHAYISYNAMTIPILKPRILKKAFSNPLKLV